MARIITDFRISYVDSTGIPRSESFDMEDFNEYEGSIDSVVNEHVAAGANNIRVEITTADYEKDFSETAPLEQWEIDLLNGGSDEV